MAFFQGRKRRHNAYCAFCRTPRRLSRKRNISFVNLLAAALASPIFMWLMWGGADAQRTPRFCTARRSPNRPSAAADLALFMCLAAKRRPIHGVGVR